MGGTPSVCTCLTRACAYSKRKDSDTLTEEGPAEKTESFDDDISKMVTKTLDDKKGAAIVRDKKVYDQLKTDISNSNIPKDLVITGSCIGFCDAVDAKCIKQKASGQSKTPSSEVTAGTEATKEGFRRRRSFVSCITLVFAITAIALLLWRVSRCHQRKPSIEVSTNTSMNASANTARLSDANA